MLRACAAHRPLPEIAALASTVRPQEDPEVDYFFASHLAYCGQTGAALQLLKRAIQGNYCFYPAIDSDPFFVSVRAKPEFAENPLGRDRMPERCGAALQLLKRAIQGNYCSYPAIDSDPFFVSVRAKPEFAEIRSAAIACQKGFLAERERMQRPHQ